MNKGICIAVLIILLIISSWYLHHRAFASSDLTLTAFKELNCKDNSTCDTPEHIPMVIYRSWKTKDLPRDYQLAWDFTTKNNPEYQQILYDDDEMDKFMETFYSGKVNNAYKKIIPNAARADLFRYCLMYEKGGVWLDIKSAAKPLCNLIRKDDKLIISTWSEEQHGGIVNFMFHYFPVPPYRIFGEFQQWWIISAPKHPMIKAVIDIVVNNIETRIAEGRFEKEIPNHWFYHLGAQNAAAYSVDTLHTTGPIAFSDGILKSKSFSSDYRLVCSDGNGSMIYDYTGNHKGGASYAGKGLFFRRD